ncbi:NmrA family NAD(P)-binding protein [Neptunicella marina]|uniref:NmrA family NAD(P)-binding protein n=1 Tax=Neptunicella marina TaxID=2125989 RepID=A0A8J6M3H8_9ALTE|nr:NmrA family NAD(P)-binding protein [Neptunicella marina]MBC3767047.1 NmrA family NAD(P)-binding protein [Neptunicella marina]
MTTLNTNQTILVVGANGKTGSRVVNLLTDKNIEVRKASRSSDTFFDWQQPSSWDAALTGVQAAYVTYFPDLALPSAPAHIQQFCELARQKGVEHITLLSGRGEEAAQICEDIVKQSGLSWNIVRCAWFNQNFNEGLFKVALDSGVLAFPVGFVKEPFVDVNDIADVVVASLTEPGHQNKLYELTGPELLSFEDLAALFSQELGKTVSFQPVSVEQFSLSLQQMGVPDEVIQMLTYLFTQVLDGRNESLADGVSQALNRPARSFADYVQRNRDVFLEQGYD